MTENDITLNWSAIKKAGGIKRLMKAKGITHGKCACPTCGAKGRCEAVLAGPRQHLHMRCHGCGWGMME